MSDAPARSALRLREAPPPLSAEQPSQARAVGRAIPSLVVGGAVFALVYENGGYGLTGRTIAALAVWMVIIVGVGLGFLPRARASRTTRWSIGLLAAYACWTLASTSWGENAESAFDSFNVLALYLGVFVLSAAAVSRRNLDRIVDGLLLAVLGVTVVALASRSFPSLFPSSSLPVFLPSAASRLSFPVGYWNGLAALVAFAAPLCLRRALSARSAALRAAAVAPLPAVAATVLLASSRGAALTALVGTACFVALADDRSRVLLAAASATAGAVVLVAILGTQTAYVEGPLGTSAAATQGHRAFAALIGCGLLAAAAWWVVDRSLTPRFHPRRRTVRVVGVAVLVLLLAAVIAAHPVRRFQDFKQLPTGLVGASNFTTAHLSSGSGSGRWQFWSAAIHEFESAPFQGRGAGSYQFWWSQHASFTYTLKNAHSLYLETLGDLGIVGLLLLLGALFVPLAAAIQRTRRAAGAQRTTQAALVGVAAAFLVGVGIDWIFQLAGVSVVAFAALALGSSVDIDRPAVVRSQARRPRAVLGLAGLVAAWAIVCAQAVPWLAAQKIDSSQAAVRRSDLRAATSEALDARSLEPWAASPYLQLGLVAEQAGDLQRAVTWIEDATRRAPTDWAVWYTAARIQREADRPAEAARSFVRAKELNPRSPLFARTP